jgi:hypothetical protein
VAITDHSAAKLIPKTKNNNKISNFLIILLLELSSALKITGSRVKKV